jgi:hypothetical protein
MVGLHPPLLGRFRSIWLRCKPIHHTVAFSKAPEPKLHHIAIEVPDRAALIDVCDLHCEVRALRLVWPPVAIS